MLTIASPRRCARTKSKRKSHVPGRLVQARRVSFAPPRLAFTPRADAPLPLSSLQPSPIDPSMPACTAACALWPRPLPWPMLLNTTSTEALPKVQISGVFKAVFCYVRRRASCWRLSNARSFSRSDGSRNRPSLLLLPKHRRRFTASPQGFTLCKRARSFAAAATSARRLTCRSCLPCTGCSSRWRFPSRS